MREQALLKPDPAGKSAEFSAACDDTVTGNKDRKMIASVRAAYGARSAWRADRFSDLAVAFGRAEGNAHQLAPDADLKRRTVKFERKIEREAIAGEVLLNLMRGLLEDFADRSALCGALLASPEKFVFGAEVLAVVER